MIRWLDAGACALGLLAVVSTAAADDAYTQCIDATTTNPEWARCGGEWVGREEEKMRAAFDDALDGASDEQKAALRDEQKAWTAYREAACHYYDTDLGREGQVLGYPGCVARLVIGRVEQLKSYSDESGDP